MGYVELSHVSFAYAGGAMLLCDVSLRLLPGITALVGENGSGKSSLLRLIAGELRPDEGSVRRVPRAGRLVMGAQSVERVSDAERRFMESKEPQALGLQALLGVQALWLARWGTLSPGERRRMQLGAALYAEPDVLLLDEPTNHLDLETRVLIIRALQRFSGITVLVSHDRAIVDALAQQTVRLHQGQLRSVQGGYSHARTVWANEAEDSARKRTELLRQTRKAEAQLRQARQVQAATVRGRSARALMKDPHDRDGRSMGRKTLAAWAESQASRGVATRRKQVDALREAVSQSHVDKPLAGKLFARHEPCPRPVLVSLVGQSIARGELTILREVSLSLPRRGRIRIQGCNGAGKSTLLHALYTAIRERERVLWLPQELTQAETMELLAQTRSLPRDDRGRVLQVVAALGVEPDRLLASSQPSPGEARKLLMAHGLGRSAWALMLDEPTHHLDLPSVERLEHALRDYPGALLVVTHDPTFLADDLDVTWQLEDQRVLARASDARA